MNALEAYDYLHAEFVKLAEKDRVPVAPQFGRRADTVELGLPPYLEICAGRWLSIAHERGILDPQWDGSEDPAHMKVFADLDALPIELLWRLRCAWFTFDVSAEQAEEEVIGIVKTATGKF